MDDVATAPDYSVIVPVYESTHTLEELVERLAAVFDGHLRASFEILLVDDGSRNPETWSICRELARRRQEVRAIRLMRNYGKPGAILCGIGEARGRFLVTLDDDLQQRPEDIPALADHRQHDVVVAHFRRRHHGPVSRISSWIKRRFDRLILGTACPMSPLKLFKAEVARGMLAIRTPYPFIPALMAGVTRDFVSVPVEQAPSQHGRSRYTLLGRLRQMSNLLINHSSLMLRCLAAFGIAVALGGFGFALVVIGRKLYGAPIQAGWSSLLVIQLIFGGLVLIALGIVGEYLIRILEGVSHKPPYLVRERAGRGMPEASVTADLSRPRGLSRVSSTGPRRSATDRPAS